MIYFKFFQEVEILIAYSSQFFYWRKALIVSQVKAAP